MTAVFHEEAQLDYDEILSYLENISQHLADQFELEFQQTLRKAKLNPFHYHFLPGSPSKRRANIKRHHHHFVYEVDEKAAEIRILIIKHDKRHPSFGLSRSWPEN